MCCGDRWGSLASELARSNPTRFTSPQPRSRFASGVSNSGFGRCPHHQIRWILGTRRSNPLDSRQGSYTPKSLVSIAVRGQTPVSAPSNGDLTLPTVTSSSISTFAFSHPPMTNTPPPSPTPTPRGIWISGLLLGALVGLVPWAISQFIPRQADEGETTEETADSGQAIQSFAPGTPTGTEVFTGPGEVQAPTGPGGTQSPEGVNTTTAPQTQTGGSPTTAQTPTGGATQTPGTGTNVQTPRTPTNVQTPRTTTNVQTPRTTTTTTNQPSNQPIRGLW